MSFIITSQRGSSRYGYPDAITPEPTEMGYNPQSLERASSIGETPYAPNGDLSYFNSNGYNGASVNGCSTATSPTPYATNGYPGYSEGSVVGANGNGNVCNENSSTVNSYNSNGNGSAQFVRRRLLPALPKGEKTLCLESTH